MYICTPSTSGIFPPVNTICIRCGPPVWVCVCVWHTCGHLPQFIYFYADRHRCTHQNPVMYNVKWQFISTIHLFHVCWHAFFFFFLTHTFTFFGTKSAQWCLAFDSNSNLIRELSIFLQKMNSISLSHKPVFYWKSNLYSRIGSPCWKGCQKAECHGTLCLCVSTKRPSSYHIEL